MNREIPPVHDNPFLQKKTPGFLVHAKAAKNNEFDYICLNIGWNKHCGIG